MRKVGSLAVRAQYPFSFYMFLAILASLLLVGCRPDPPKALDLAGNPVDPFVNRAPRCGFALRPD